MEAPARNPRTRFGPFEEDSRSGEMYKHGIRLKLQDQPFQVLALLLERPGDVVTREDLRQKLWPARSEEHTSELQSRLHLVCRLLLDKQTRHPVREVHDLR